MNETNSLALAERGAPFDSLRRVDENGEFWLARELMPVMGYEQWRKFEGSINRAKLACANSGQAADLHFCRLRQLGQNGTPRIDYRLTRYGAYLTAMNGDPRKDEISAAQTYFAVQARQAEMIQAGDDLDVIEGMIRAIRADRARLDAVEDGQKQLAARMDGIEGTHDWFSALAYARYKGLSTEHVYLQRLGREAARITREHGAVPGQTQHALYGTVGTYPETALDEAAAVVPIRPAPSRPAQRSDSTRPRR